MTEKSVNISGQKISYRVAGEGPRVMLVHGFAEDQDVWRYQAPLIASKYRLIIPDLPGSGNSGRIPEISMESMAEVLRQILATETNDEYKAATMVGHSMGGYITLAFADKHPELLDGFGLFHSTAFPDTEEKKATRRKSIEFIQKHGTAEFIRQSTPNLFTENFRNNQGTQVADLIERNSHFDPQSLIAYYRAMIERPERINTLKAFLRPILFIIGQQDKAVPYEDSLKQCYLPRMAAVHILESSAHMGMWEEQEKSSQALLSFLEWVQEARPQ